MGKKQVEHIVRIEQCENGYIVEWSEWRDGGRIGSGKVLCVGLDTLSPETEVTTWLAGFLGRGK